MFVTFDLKYHRYFYTDNFLCIIGLICLPQLLYIFPYGHFSLFNKLITEKKCEICVSSERNKMVKQYFGFLDKGVENKCAEVRKMWIFCV